MDVMYFIFIFISPSIPRFSVKKSVKQLIKNKRHCEAENMIDLMHTRFNLILSNDDLSQETIKMVLYGTWMKLISTQTRYFRTSDAMLKCMPM